MIVRKPGLITPLENITVRKIASGFMENPDKGTVTAMDGMLDIRPDYHRQYFYTEADAKAIAKSISEGYPIGEIYFGTKPKVKPEHYTVIDGAQRLTSICRFINGKFPIEIDGGESYFSDLVKKTEFLDYELPVFLHKGTIEEQRAWYMAVNRNGYALDAQEMRSSIYRGRGTSEAVRYFTQIEGSDTAYGYITKGGRPARDYNYGSFTRQIVLWHVLMWYLCTDSQDAVARYMDRNKNSVKEAGRLIAYFKDVMDWASLTFTDYEPGMKKVSWGAVYAKYGKTLALSRSMIRSRLKKADDLKNDTLRYLYALSGDKVYLDGQGARPNNEQSVSDGYAGKDEERNAEDIASHTAISTDVIEHICDVDVIAPDGSVITGGGSNAYDDGYSNGYAAGYEKALADLKDMMD